MLKWDEIDILSSERKSEHKKTEPKSSESRKFYLHITILGKTTKANRIFGIG